MPDRRTSLVLRLVLASMPLCACGDATEGGRATTAATDDGGALPTTSDLVLPPPGSQALPATRLLDAAPHGTHRLRRPLRERIVLLDPCNDPPDTWRPYLFPDREATTWERNAFEARSPLFPDGTMVIGRYGGGRVALLQVEPGSDLIVSARVSTHALVDHTMPGEDSSGAMLGVVELAGDPGGLANAASLVTKVHWTTPLLGDHDEDVQLFVDLKGSTRWVGIAVSQPMPQEDPAAEMRVTGLTVSTPDLVDVARELAYDDALLSNPARVPRGRFSIRHVERPSLLLLPGSEITLDVRGPDAPTTFETSLGLVPHGSIEGGNKVVVRWEFRDAEAAPDAAPLLVGERTLVTLGLSNSRWGQIVVPLPSAARGRPLRVRFTADAQTPGAPALAVLGTPRLVPGDPPRVGPNLVLVSIDTLRSDRLGCYGYARPTSPRIDAFSRTATLFTDTWANGPFTLPSHVSMLSGQFPSVHGVQRTGDRIDPVRTHTLAQILRAHGWATGAFTAGGYLDSEFGFGSGFQRYSTLDPVANLGSERILSMLDKYNGIDEEMLAESDVNAVVAWIQRNARQSFFLFLHTYAVHQFDPPAWALAALGDADVPLRVPDDDVGAALATWELPEPRMLARLDELYDASVRQADDFVGRVLDALDALDLSDDTVVVVTADHGKELGEHGLVAHGHSLYEELLQVPLLVRVPGRPPARVDDPAMLVDVLPTVLAALGLPRPDGIQGRDLFDAAAKGPRPLLSEVDDVARKVALREGRFKTIWGPDLPGLPIPNPHLEETFDLEADPHEQHALPPDPRRIELVRDVEQSLRNLGASLGGRLPGETPLSAETEAQLRELGYLGDE
ncbi:MAG: sulfatase [Planctomycetes bacterium]|nr:sulfatase [Planctomycetota bacterium]